MKKVSRVLLTIITVILAVVLTATTLLSCLIACVRVHFTSDYLNVVTGSMDYSSVRLTDAEGNTASLLGWANIRVAPLGLQFTDGGLKSTLHEFKIDKFFTDYVQDIRSWILDDGPAPHIDSAKAAKNIADGLDEQLYRFLVIFGDPVEVLSPLLEKITLFTDPDLFQENGRILQKIFAADTMIFVISVSAAIFLIMLIAQRMNFVSTAIYTSSACVIAGSCMVLAEFLLDPLKESIIPSAVLAVIPSDTVNMVYNSFIGTVSYTGTVVSIGGLAAVVVFAAIGIVISVIRRKKSRAQSVSCENELTHEVLKTDTEDINSAEDINNTANDEIKDTNY